MVAKKDYDRFALNASGMVGIHTAPLRKQRQDEAKRKAKGSKSGKNGR